MKTRESTEQTIQRQPANLSEPEVQMALDQLRAEQNLVMATLAGLVAAVVGASMWAAVTVATGYQIGWLAIGIGFAVGFAIRHVGKGIDQIFGVVAGVLSLIGCALGNLLTVAYFVADAEGVPYVELLAQMNLDVAIEIMTATFDPMDIVFYAIAVYFGYRYAFRELTDADFARALGKAF
ncbi:MAG: hypothetical protein OER22_04465 [Gammaproteobacteria bacterium]|nr:hypothetical protein [Gammaproteobacteria bacterium]MDH3372463.1 hypothetical protein [Gammaproteobacteria bacterium]MDH3407899.1 hypothetical protein [Gammaproteobacteria bacterium]MDH3551849.1 hypothetical protein [Gammaproteobacteria bacterium]